MPMYKKQQYILYYTINPYIHIYHLIDWEWYWKDWKFESQKLSIDAQKSIIGLTTYWNSEENWYIKTTTQANERILQMTLIDINLIFIKNIN